MLRFSQNTPAHQLLPDFRDVAFAQPGRFCQVTDGPTSGLFLRGKGEQQLSDTRADSLALFRSGVFFISDDRTLVVSAKHKMHVAGLVQKIHSRFDQPFCGRSRDVARQQQEGFVMYYTTELGLSHPRAEDASVETRTVLFSS